MGEMEKILGKFLWGEENSVKFLRGKKFEWMQKYFGIKKLMVFDKNSAIFFVSKSLKFL
jgi:hypothetical protein